jgi:hypothetical protein
MPSQGLPAANPGRLALRLLWLWVVRLLGWAIRSVGWSPQVDRQQAGQPAETSAHHNTTRTHACMPQANIVVSRSEWWWTSEKQMRVHRLMPLAHPHAQSLNDTLHDVRVAKRTIGYPSATHGSDFAP